MDSVTVMYYGLICAILSLMSPRIGQAPVRFGLGLAVGFAASGLLPALRDTLGI